jgi:hypothetical protein
VKSNAPGNWQLELAIAIIGDRPLNLHFSFCPVQV